MTIPPSLSPAKLRHDSHIPLTLPPTISPRLDRTKSKGKERERPPLVREVGSATISLRQDMVERLVSEDEGDLNRPGPSRPRKVNSGQPEPPKSHPFPKVHTLTPPRARRPRANSIHLPPQSNGVDRSFYLSHYSTDQQYSLKQGDVNLELGLGDDFDMSFGEALRRGLGGQEMALPRQALRVLSEAKDNLDLHMMGKQGRKGSIGMGLFRESRAAAHAAMLKVRKKDEMIEEPSARTTSPASDPPASIRGMPSRRDRETLDDEGMEYATSAGIQVVSSPLLPDRLTPRKSRHSIDETINSPLEDDSGWTTTSTGSVVSEAEEEERIRREIDDDLEGTDTGSDEERMTVPLQPFNHAVGGHSSIYNFTRRAVCKVSQPT